MADMADSGTAAGRAQIGMTMLSQKQIPRHVIIGILANAAGESSIDPSAVEFPYMATTADGNGIGIFQWTYKSNKADVANHMGRSETDFSYQFTYAVTNASQWGPRPDIAAKYNITFQQFLTNKSTDDEFLTLAWFYCWERPAVQNDGAGLARLDKLKSYFNGDLSKLKGGNSASASSNSGSKCGSTGSGSSNQQEAALWIYPKSGWVVTQGAHQPGTSAFQDHVHSQAWDWTVNGSDNNPIYAPFSGTAYAGEKTGIVTSAWHAVIVISDVKITTSGGQSGYAFFYTQHSNTAPVLGKVKQGQLISHTGSSPAGYVTGDHAHIVCGLLSAPSLSLVKAADMGDGQGYNGHDWSIYGDIAMKEDFDEGTNLPTYVSKYNQWQVGKFFCFTTKDVSNNANSDWGQPFLINMSKSKSLPVSKYSGNGDSSSNSTQTEDDTCYDDSASKSWFFLQNVKNSRIGNTGINY